MARMVLKQKSITIFLVVMLFSSTVVSIWVSIWHSQNKDRFRGEIVISNDSDFKRKFNFPGSGTKNDPFRLEFLQIKTTKDYGIKISDTTSYFVIRNCTIQAIYDAILIIDVNFGTALICNNTLNSTFSIQVLRSPGITITNNICKYGFTGILLAHCLNSTIMSNFCLNSTYGIALKGNISNSIIQNNYLVGHKEIGLYYDYWDEYSFSFYQNYNVSISNNTCILSKAGIKIDEFLELPTVVKTTFIVESNNCSFNEFFGIGIRSHLALIKNNYCGFNDIGLSIVYSHNSTFIENQLQNNTSFGISIGHSSGCFIYSNNFFDNNVDGPILMDAQAFDDSTIESHFGQNTWFYPLISEGNYWSDLIWIPGITYDINGSNNTDPFPIQNPIV